MARFTTRPAFVDAVQYTGGNEAEVHDLCPGATSEHTFGSKDMTIYGADGIIILSPGEWLIRHSHESRYSVLADPYFRRAFAPVLGCHCDLEPGQDPDVCVLDVNRPNDCIYSHCGDKSNCKYWHGETHGTTPT